MTENKTTLQKNYFVLIFLSYTGFILFFGDYFISSFIIPTNLQEIIVLVFLGLILLWSGVGLVMSLKRIIRPKKISRPPSFILSYVGITFIGIGLVLSYIFLPLVFQQLWSSIFLLYSLIIEISGNNRFFIQNLKQSKKSRSFFNIIGIITNISVIVVGFLLWNKYNFSTIQHIYGYFLVVVLTIILIENLFEFFFHRANFSIASYTALQMLFFTLIIIISILFTAEITSIHKIVYFYLVLTTAFALRFKISEPIYYPNRMSYSI